MPLTLTILPDDPNSQKGALLRRSDEVIEQRARHAAEQQLVREEQEKEKGKTPPRKASIASQLRRFSTTKQKSEEPNRQQEADKRKEQLALFTAQQRAKIESEERARLYTDEKGMPISSSLGPEFEPAVQAIIMKAKGTPLVNVTPPPKEDKTKPWKFSYLEGKGHAKEWKNKEIPTHDDPTNRVEHVLVPILNSVGDQMTFEGVEVQEGVLNLIRKLEQEEASLGRLGPNVKQLKDQLGTAVKAGIELTPNIVLQKNKDGQDVLTIYTPGYRNNPGYSTDYLLTGISIKFGKDKHGKDEFIQLDSIDDFEKQNYNAKNIHDVSFEFGDGRTLYLTQISDSNHWGINYQLDDEGRREIFKYAPATEEDKNENRWTYQIKLADGIHPVETTEKIDEDNYLITYHHDGEVREEQLQVNEDGDKRFFDDMAGDLPKKDARSNPFHSMPS